VADLKAQFGVKWALVIMIVTIILVIAAVSPYQQAIEEAIATSAYIHAIEVAGIIDRLQTSPNTTLYKYYLPDMDCKIKIGEDVNFTVINGDEEKSYIADIIKSDIIIEPAEYECSGSENLKAIVFTRETYADGKQRIIVTDYSE